MDPALIRRSMNNRVGFQTHTKTKWICTWVNVFCQPEGGSSNIGLLQCVAVCWLQGVAECCNTSEGLFLQKIWDTLGRPWGDCDVRQDALIWGMTHPYETWVSNEIWLVYMSYHEWVVSATRCTTLQHTATHCPLGGCLCRQMSRVCNTKQHAVTHCNALQHTAHGAVVSSCNMRADTTHLPEQTRLICRNRQPYSSCNMRGVEWMSRVCNTLQHTTTHCSWSGGLFL